METTSNPKMPGLIERARAIIVSPRQEWPRIAAEPETIGGLYRNYILILAAIGPIAMLIGSQLFGFSAFGITYRPSLGGSLAMALVQYASMLVGLAVLAFAINFLAPRFGGQQDLVQAFKVAAYSATPGLISGICNLVPALSVLGIVGLYGLYLLYLGLPVLMKAPAEKSLVYTIVTVLAAALLMIVASALTPSFSGRGLLAGNTATDGALSGAVEIPGVGSLDLAKMEAATKRIEESAKRAEQTMAEGQPAALSPQALQALLPDQLGRFRRVELSGAGTGMGAKATGHYAAGDDDLTVELVDMAVIGVAANLGSALNLQSNRQTATSYEKTETVDGRIVNESWNSETRNGEYSTTVADRFMVKASGTVADVGELRAAVQAMVGKLAQAG